MSHLAVRGRGNQAASVGGRASTGASGAARKVAGLAIFRATGTQEHGGGFLPRHPSRVQDVGCMLERLKMNAFNAREKKNTFSKVSREENERI